METQIAKNCIMKLYFLDQYHKILDYERCDRSEDILYINLIITHNDIDYNFIWHDDDDEGRRHIIRFFKEQLDLIQNEEITWLNPVPDNLLICINKERIFILIHGKYKFETTLLLTYR